MCMYPHTSCHVYVACAEAIGGGVLIPEGHRDDSEESEVQSFVVPVTNGIQLETRRHNRRSPTGNPAATGDVRHQLLYKRVIFNSIVLHARQKRCRVGCILVESGLSLVETLH